MPLNDSQYQHLATLFSADKRLTETSDCLPYGYDNSRLQATPDAVVFATTTEEIQTLVQWCNAERIPLLARGRGTGTTGATVPLQGGIVLALERMNKIIDVDAANRMAIVQPGVINQDLQQAAGEHGFFWPPDPTSAAFCTIGGNLAYNSAGPRTLKYGTPRENTLGLTAVTGTGEIIHTGVKTTKGVVGYDLTRLLIGSEGTLAIITEATLKLTAKPAAKKTLQITYKDINSAAHAVSSVMAQSIIPCALEFIDGRCVEMIRSYSNADLPDNAAAMLMIEVDGPSAGLAEAAEQVKQAAMVDGYINATLAQTEEDVQALWATRKALSPALRTIAPKKINEDVVVPVSKMPDLINGLAKLEQTHQIMIANFGHAGNGNIHVNLLCNPDDEEEMQRAEACLNDVFKLVLNLQGSISGEHGIGIVKRDFVAQELDPVSLRLMNQIKQQFDPNGILNAGKSLPIGGA